ncbi:hypothetical protein [Granulicella mallensis]|uniref:Uncharacterized protein n=1 Tax=Granulicella mallensis (strain ATCC BAA-1857 / DSM 23137 / MP5ACTX8) TaxID=682795 RepID=G8NX93_GRAMM|nr:hypothetical protein [Granulicella mallensis]AEU36707.1 hypothetical protein AciX8_2390 [Granulicella mallensis MP5ACTX8]
MSGNSHQRKIVETAVASAIKRGGAQAPPPPKPEVSKGALGRSSIEAYGFFIIAGVYVVMSAFGIPVNFFAGLGMAFCMAGAAIHLLWSSIWTHNWNTLSKVFGNTIIVLLLAVVVNAGYEHTRVQKTDPTLSAVRNLTDWIEHKKPEIPQNTQIFEVNGKHPDIEAGDPRDVPLTTGKVVAGLELRNDGDAPAFAQRNTLAIFIGTEGFSTEDTIFRFLYLHDRDRGENVPSQDLGSHSRSQMVWDTLVLRPDGSPVDDSDRIGISEGRNVVYYAALISYQDETGRQYHKEICYFAVGPNVRTEKCKHHNGHG